ncbi:hypothetical protein DVH24_019750 [Malus domestica]|uniref:Uncharacterized protein n=1 Tax=Malus domestica TaxID=3750 RepID=A0A498I3Q1_MALDO|nr:hypothetical protein DVH24_019750 [Malus domestica]
MANQGVSSERQEDLDKVLPRHCYSLMVEEYKLLGKGKKIKVLWDLFFGSFGWKETSRFFRTTKAVEGRICGIMFGYGHLYGPRLL